ncbi:MAG TPA: sigma-70 family RNA polymerase sigma factor [Terriglobales bacterium]|jgi:RNA polymerase sigma factor (TIGR02999 family)|nr:sigma-70 family RNA polymerase sigma factor [Terriglobales bacterium]
MLGSSEVPSKVELTQLLKAWGEGDDGALERLTTVVEDELHRMAHRWMSREKPGHTLQTTALVNEVYLRLVDIQAVNWQDRAHFFAISARLMRRILTDFARSRNYQKRGAGAVQVSLDQGLLLTPEKDADIMALDAALTRLAVLYPRHSQVVELRFFGGLEVEEAAEALKVSPVTVKRDWRFAKAWLLRAMRGEASGEPVDRSSGEKSDGC